ncbi:MAG: 5-(carboxyamino)imidazole ribonucleotide synthase [Bryobacteraceae bacterium]|nr:5-(carboxyamino)imidazole ribonucleotide synthase [Bryobacteraceae bacterium]MDW8379248.1 5-(carboxyamino)imidazole ribonucleotide synthase [Bryobacterales bacterium]
MSYPADGTPVLPGSCIGVLGSGQLGRMFAIAARRMGYRVHTYSPDSDTPTGQVSDEEITGSYEDLDKVREFASRVQVVTFEFENVPAATAAAAAERAPVRPAGIVLHTTQQRVREKTFLSRNGLPVTPYRVIDRLEDLRVAIAELGCPAILKTADFGYDGKGQRRINAPSEAAAAWAALGEREAVLEAFVPFTKEVSVVASRSIRGEFAHYGVVENEHRNHILDVTVAPARVSDRVRAQAEEITRTVLEKLDVVGVLCVEFFLTGEDELLINELAPRPHNSGHFTFDACITSQFEQQLRAVCGLPLGSTELMRPAAMANLLGDLWAGQEPDWSAAAAFPEVKIHLYGKTEARPGRKMGHLTALAHSPDEASQIVRAARAALTRNAALSGPACEEAASADRAGKICGPG